MCSDPDIDIVDLGTRPSVRLPMLIEALRHGKHIYNSCPHAPDWAGAKAIDAAWDRSKSQVAVDAFSRYLPAHKQMKQMVDDGFLGEILGGTCHFNLSLFNQPDKKFPYNWFADRTAGVSALRNNGGHLLYLLCEMLGPVKELVADDSQLLKKWVFDDGDSLKPETNDHADLILRFVSGASIALQASWSMTVQEGWTIDLFGTKGRLQARSPTFPTAKECQLAAGRIGETLAPVAIAYPENPDIAMNWKSNPAPSYPMALTMYSLVAAIKGHGLAFPDFALALEVERVLEAARMASDERRWVEVSSVV